MSREHGLQVSPSTLPTLLLQILLLMHFNERMEEQGNRGGESGKENRRMFRHGTCTVKSSHALPSSELILRKLSTQLPAALPIFYQYREQEEVNTPQVSWYKAREVFDSALDRQQVQLTALPLTLRLNPNKSQLTGFSLPGCSYMISVLFLEVVQRT